VRAVRDGKLIAYRRYGECVQCGQCCGRWGFQFSQATGPTRALTSAEVDLIDYEGWAATESKDGLTLNWWGPLRARERDAPCEAYDPETKTCTAYDKRPEICQAFPLRPEDVPEGCGYWFEEVEGKRMSVAVEHKTSTLQFEVKTQPMNVLLLTIDALRRDRCLRTMKRFQKWAREHAVFFANHYSVAHCSDPNYLSILSGIHPDEHGVLTQIMQVKEQESWQGYPAFPSIALWLKKHFGHKCGGYTATYPRFYYYGFDEVTPMGRNVKTVPGWVQAKTFMESAKDEGRPWYFFIRTMDCHAPYKNGKYSRAVKFTDKVVMDLIGYIMAEHPHTLIVFCSDHGELLGEHGMREHFSTLYQELLRIPMYMYWPDCPGGLVVEEFTQHIDIAPTIIDLFDVGEDGYAKSVGHMNGQSMLMAMAGIQLRQQMTFVGEGVYAEAYQQHRALIQWPWKYIATAHISEGPKFELYNLEEDPKEQTNLAQEMPERLLKMSHTLATSHWRARKFVRPDTAEAWTRQYRDMMGITEEEGKVIVERLRALGYAD